jgi:hypothetical protein
VPRIPAMSEKMLAGRLRGSVAEVLDAALELLPDYEMAAISVLDSAERPAEWPTVRRRLRAEGVRTRESRGVLLLMPGELDRLASVGFFTGGDEVLLLPTWDDEFESFPGHLTTDAHDFNIITPLGLEDWLLTSSCVLAMGDGTGLNFATLDPELAGRLRARFPVAK